ncbi:hypothetical protein SAMN04487898_115128 [Pedobacter sp. ok626]|uniref:hypothetical protein n=1 Tax=Pedobacter sp. ok626 TaxID=1761882 RepID=UPI000891E90B|nr:hypothetical protein [Pedobacter sp. ok626]SDL15116.1 hypothetical protein SAMN04487898_115128 [Pedobacter sp. ok626]
MKKLILTISLIGLALGVFAQLGIDAEVNLANYKYAEKVFDVQHNASDPAIKTRNVSFNVSWIFAKKDN